MNVKKKFLCLLALSVCTMPTLWANGMSSTSSNAAVQQETKGTVTGKVVDKSGESLIGVSVKVKGSSVAAITDVNGAFSINNISSSDILVFSYIGMNNQEVKVGSQTLLNVAHALANLDFALLLALAQHLVRVLYLSMHLRHSK